jgi:dihydroorotase/N-acyl-D-amino-acid deacylase
MTTLRSSAASCLLLPLLLACASPDAGKPYDVVITNAKIVDGTGNPWYYGDVGVRGDKIATIAPRNALANEPANERIDANGLALSPGFIDIQAHSWSALLFADGRDIGKVSQGVTSEILGESSTPGAVQPERRLDLHRHHRRRLRVRQRHATLPR